MHDYHAVEALVQRLTVDLDTSEIERITEVRVRTSAIYSAEALKQAFEMLTRNTSLEGSVLVVEERLAERDCPGCGKPWTPTHDDLAGHLLVCPSCGMPSANDGGAGIAIVGLTWSGAGSGGRPTQGPSTGRA
jgi:Zn finger protein HypA/HybF involved in hydrogenase expression